MPRVSLVLMACVLATAASGLRAQNDSAQTGSKRAELLGAKGVEALSLEPSDISLKLGFHMQYRYTASHAPGEDGQAGDPSIGFGFRRMRPKLAFGALDGKLGLTVLGEASGGELRLLDGALTLEPRDGVRARVGQFYLRYNREFMVSASKPLAADRSSLAITLNPGATGRVQGAELELTAELDRAVLTLSEGLDVPNTNYNDERSDWGITGRYERLLIGESFKPFAQHTAPRGTPEGLLLGAAAHAQSLRGLGERAAFTADLSYQNDGFSAMATAGVLIAEDRNHPSIGEPEHQYGFVAQAGQYIGEKLEPFVRGEYAFTSGDHPDLQLLTVGFNYYFYGQALRFTLDGTAAFDGVGPAHDRSSDGLLITADGDARYAVRAQIQVIF